MTTARGSKPPAIARIWRGRTTAARADDYARYLHEHGIRPLADKALGVQMLREDRAGETERAAGQRAGPRHRREPWPDGGRGRWGRV